MGYTSLSPEIAANASTKSAPSLHWAEAIPAGYIDADFVIKDTPFFFAGIGAHDRFWATESWFALVEG